MVLVAGLTQSCWYIIASSRTGPQTQIPVFLEMVHVHVYVIRVVMYVCQWATWHEECVYSCAGKGPSKRQRAAVSEAGPSLHDNLPTPKAVEAGRDQMCLHAHEQELTESLDRELHDLLQSK